jgi:hypothetical protein
MGWSSGTTVMEKIMNATKAVVEDGTDRKRLYIEFIGAFEDADWDNIDECVGIDEAFDEAVAYLYPDFEF